MAMSYLKVRWKHSFSDEPNLLYSELDDARWELRKVEVFPDGRLGYASIAQRLTIPQSPTGYQVLQFPTPTEGLAQLVFRTDTGFVGGGYTAGGAQEFVIPNGTIPSNTIITKVP